MCQILALMNALKEEVAQKEVRTVESVERVEERLTLSEEWNKNPVSEHSSSSENDHSRSQAQLRKEEGEWITRVLRRHLWRASASRNSRKRPSWKLSSTAIKSYPP
jgi:hypothetical protein